MIPMVETGAALTGSTEVGDQLHPVRRTITREAINAYRSASGDNNRIHYDDEFAAETRFGGVIAHGMLTLTLVSEMMARSYGGNWLTTGTLRVRFRGAAYPGDTLEASGVVSKCEPEECGAKITCAVELNNSESGERIITGTATVLVGTVEEGVDR